MRKLLLISNSTSHGSGYLDHCAGNIEDFLGGSVETVAFLPYAKKDQGGYTATARNRFNRMGYRLKGIHDGGKPVDTIRDSDAIFIGGGNTFLLLKTLYDMDLIEPIRKMVLDGKPYVGTSAGSNVACRSIMTTNDMPIVYPPSFEALNLVPFNLNPHYIDPDPGSTHKGETRIRRIEEFHQFNDVPVIGLREGSMLRVEGKWMTLLGPTGGKLFMKEREPEEYGTGSDLSFLL
jgi:dipeptidase E